MKRWIVFLVLSGIFLASAGLLLIFFREVTQGTLKFEIAKSLLQLGVVAVAGALVSLLVFEYQRDRQAVDKQLEIDRQRLDKDKEIDRQRLEKERESQRKALEYREALLMSVLSKAMDSYGKAKKARRLLRARAVSTSFPSPVVVADQYDACFDMLNGAQLELENLARDVETSAKAFSNATAIAGHLRSMDSYLGHLITEYERSRSQFAGDKPSLPLDSLPDLRDFLGPTKSSPFRLEMVIPYHEVQRAIRGDLLHPNLPSGKVSLRPGDGPDSFSG